MLTDAKIAAIKPPTRGREEYRDLRVKGLRLRVGAGKKTWIVRSRAGQKVINKKLGSYPQMGLAAARSAAEKVIDALARDGGVQALDRTFGAVANLWIEKVAKPRNDTWRLQERRLELHVLPHWRDLKIAEIRRADVRHLIEAIDGVSLPNMVLALVRPIFRYALSRDWIEVSPVEGISKPNEDKPRDRVLSIVEITQVWQAAELLGYPLGAYVRALVLTAQRRTEVASMRWSDVDLDSGVWIIPASETKSERKQLVPLSSPMVALLRSVPHFGEYVFTSNGKTHISSYAKGKQRLDSFIAAVGEKLEPWTLHDLRRSAATHMVRLGVSTEVVGRVLNHAPKGVTARVYALHEFTPEKRHALEAWAAEVERAVGGTSRTLAAIDG